MIGNLRLPPVLSVILPVYNAKHFVEHAVVSILQQSYSNFELIIIDDGSFDGTTDILKRLSSQNARIVLLIRENRGLVASLNEGIRMARGEFIARMDADDVALTQRFTDQIAYLHRTGYDLCGTAIQCFGKSELVWRYPSTPAEVEVQLLFDSPYAHPSTMCKASLYKTLGYRNVFAGAEDYDFMAACLAIGSKGR
ncbi:glycosyltransferase family 2 protein [Candidatus Aalborgicola defluviihabitans]|uniref:glycosyltransferase family 2 protein n=1 Tax=Candidatus Aalborgicola defluviihabitans TaxID=3386187 RepID=UPI001DAF3F14|nr:glycosyltransferase family 2 protein [Burkholderiales bacterium]